MVILSLLTALALGVDRVSLVLPPGEAASAWASPAALGGLVLGPEGPGPQVRLSISGERWQVVAVDQDGSEKAAFILAPRTSAQREDAIWLAESLLASLPHPPDLGQGARRPLTLPPDPPRPIPPPAAAPRKARPIVEAPAAEVVDPAVVEAPPEPTEPPAEPIPAEVTAGPPAPPPAEPPACPPVVLPPAKPTLSLHPWLTAGPTLALRPGSGAGAGLSLDGGLGLGASLALGLGLDWESGRSLSGVPGTALMRTLDAEATVGWVPTTTPWAPILGLVGGLSWRSYAQDGLALDPTRGVVVSVDAGVGRSLSEALSLSLRARLGLDTATTWLELADGTVLALSPVQGELRLSLSARIP